MIFIPANVRILYIEDDEDDFFLAREYLDEIAKGTYEVEWAPTYDSGWSRICDREHDVYLIDYRLGAKTGLELIQEARASGFDKPMILLTGLGDRDIDMAAMKAGADDYIAKGEVNSALLDRSIRYATNQYKVSLRLKESEERLRDYVDTASDWIWEMDTDLVFKSISGGSSDEILDLFSNNIGKKIWEIDWIDPKSSQWEDHISILEAHKPFYNFEYPVKSPSGSAGFFQISGKPIFGTEGEFLGYRGTGQNITEQREMEAQLRQSNKMEAVGQLTGGIAHDFNNILHVVNSSLELIEDSVEGDEYVQKKIRQVLKAIQRGSHLTNQLLSFSRQQSLIPERCSANHVVVETLGLLERTIREDITINTVLNDSIPEIKVDKAALSSAILNLAVNARDAMPRGGELIFKTATVDLDKEMFDGTSEPASGIHVKIEISDNGNGIPESILSRVFEPFFTTKEVGKGTGLGLSMVYGFVCQSAGHMSIKSIPESGTCVELYFPALQETDEESVNTPQDKQPAYKMVPCTILLVEDDDLVREATAEMLERMGFTVIQAENGNAAINVLGSRKQDKGIINMVLSDVIMPGKVSGIDLARKVKEEYPNIKILLASGYPDRETSGQYAANDLSAADFRMIRKPYSRDLLGKTISELMTVPYQ